MDGASRLSVDEGRHRAPVMPATATGPANHLVEGAGHGSSVRGSRQQAIAALPDMVRQGLTGTPTITLRWCAVGRVGALRGEMVAAPR